VLAVDTAAPDVRYVAVLLTSSALWHRWQYAGVVRLHRWRRHRHGSGAGLRRSRAGRCLRIAR
jgi:hypothetical protein